jgi:hypothetical protein
MDAEFTSSDVVVQQTVHADAESLKVVAWVYELLFLEYKNCGHSWDHAWLGLRPEVEVFALLGDIKEMLKRHEYKYVGLQLLTFATFVNIGSQSV